MAKTLPVLLIGLVLWGCSEPDRLKTKFQENPPDPTIPTTWEETESEPERKTPPKDRDESSQDQEGDEPTDQEGGEPTDNDDLPDAADNNSAIDSAPDNASAWIPIPLTLDDWTTIYTGYGEVVFNPDATLTLDPMAATSPDETHAALVVLNDAVFCPSVDFTIRVTATTQTQLRTPPANPWEVFWLFFNYEDDPTFQTNYLILKPNGIELGKAFGDSLQEFLYTAPSPQLVLGQPATYEIVKIGTSLQISINGEPIFAEPQDFPLFLNPGQIGLYTEDATVIVHEVLLQGWEDS